jgi:CRP-like cAMP-binding protein
MTAQPTIAKPHTARPLTHKLAQLVTLGPDGIAVLEDLQSTTRIVRRNREILTEGQKYEVLFVLIDGVSIRYRVLHDGRRQILNIPILVAAEPGEAHRGAQFPEFGLLLHGDVEGFAIEFLGGLRMPLP